MDSDNESYCEESSEAEEEVAGPLQMHIKIDEPPESPLARSPSPVLPQPIPVEEPSHGWELPDDGNNFLNGFTRQDVLEIQNRALETRRRINEEGYVVEALVILKISWHFSWRIMVHNGI